VVYSGNAAHQAFPPVEPELFRRSPTAAETQRLLVDLLSITSDIAWEMDHNLRIVSSCDSLATGVAYSCFEGKTVQDILGGDPASDRLLDTQMRHLGAHQPFRGIVHAVPASDGKFLWLETNGNPIFDSEGVFQGYRGTTRDITRRKTDEARIIYHTRRDWLTDLPSRLSVRERLQEALAAMKEGKFLATLVLDLDDFKLTNDTLGHAVGDCVLHAVGERLAASVRHGDLVARLGGDEFAIVQADLDEPAEAGAFAHRLADLMSRPYELGGHRIVASVTIGIALAGADEIEPEQILKNAAIALSVAKVEAQGSWRFFKPEMLEILEARRRLEADLRNALENEEFELFYQPLYKVESGEICAFEALVRWRHPQRGMIMPSEFIPIAEETGLIVPLGEWILLKACLEAVTWREHISVAVNLSSLQFRNTTPVKAVIEALALTGLAPGRLELEITETVLMLEGNATLTALHELRALGVRISMDDFGTGYSSLSYLRKFPFDKIKIDRSFIQDLNQKQSGIAIVHAIAALGSSLHLATTAEGIETMEQFEIVRAEGCTEVQGFLFSPPRPANEIPRLLSACGPDAAAEQGYARRPLMSCQPRSVAFPESSPPRFLVDVPCYGNILNGQTI
jgi:diguanylate cyclase (GGDEF)-like protein/PAS domain S-box-containing protein